MRPSYLLQLSLLGQSYASVHDHLHQRSSSLTCDNSTRNTTVGSYIVSENETISYISTAVNRGICDIARANRMPDALLPLYEGHKLIIPAEVCQPDNTTCLVVQHDHATYANCVTGGPHTYYTPPCSEDVAWFISTEPLPLNVQSYNAVKKCSSSTLATPKTPLVRTTFFRLLPITRAKMTVS